ncbi:hypothetical protein LTR62_004232 [Meristemomyces frigidus]|uniref:Translocation protein sec66 n=1 Tax=Meristemomyces frigidus TaxID=1508187 RepID=A0AAN7TI27_9PEZI|nr:hypothetical protein LTR62_004232 [Meristemomyces frigidus]
MDNTTFNSTFNSSTNGTNGTSDGLPPPIPKSFWTNLLLPTLYLIIVVGSLYTFSTLYRKSQLSKTARLEPWFPAHRQRDIYLSLLHLDPSEESSAGDDEKKLKRVPDSVLKAALMQRALEDIRRIVQLRSSKQALQTLLQRGSVGDELWQRFLRAEQEMEAEVKDVVNEANAFAPNWGQVIFQSANEMNQNLLIKDRMKELQDKLESEKAWWEKKKAGIQSNFLKEHGVEDDVKSEDTAAATVAKPVEKRPGSSDEEGILVDVDVPTQSQGAGGSTKKKKGKK